MNPLRKYEASKEFYEANPHLVDAQEIEERFPVEKHTIPVVGYRGHIPLKRGNNMFGENFQKTALTSKYIREKNKEAGNVLPPSH